MLPLTSLDRKDKDVKSTWPLWTRMMKHMNLAEREESDFLQFMKIKKYLHEILLIEQDYFRDLFLVKTLC